MIVPAYDAVIIGAGHNGLTCAGYLARAGLKVKVVEARRIVGGACITEEFHPGFRNSTCSYVVSLLNPKIVRDLELTRYGLKILRRPVEGFYPRPDGSSLLYTTDKRQFKAELERLMPGDGEGFDRFDADLHAVLGAVRALMFTTPPNFAGSWRDLLNGLIAANEARKLDPHARSVLARLMTQSAGDFLDHYFKGELVKGALGYLAAVGNFQSVYAPGSAYVLLHHVFGEHEGEDGAWGHALGGMGAITQAMAKSAEAHGAEIEVNAPVAEVIVEHGRAAGVVLAGGRMIRAKLVAANINPKLLFGKLVDPSLFPEDFARDIAHYRCASGTLRLNVALSELPDFTARPGKGDHLTGSISITPSLAYLEDAYRDAKIVGLPRKPAVEVCIPSIIDPTLAPEGKHVASLFCQHFNPLLPDGRDWDDAKEEAADRVIDTVTQYAPNFGSAIIARKVLTPKDLEREFGLVGGDIFHGCLHMDQLFSLRPAPGFADYRTPVAGLYLCGSGAHPGGGVSGIPGHNAAREILRDVRKRKIKGG
jgi:phytoene dehydrogenase-like protein